MLDPLAELSKVSTDRLRTGPFVIFPMRRTMLPGTWIHDDVQCGIPTHSTFSVRKGCAGKQNGEKEFTARIALGAGTEENPKCGRWHGLEKHPSRQPITA